MVGREDVHLTAEERAVLARLEASAAQDRRLARRLARPDHPQRLRDHRLPDWPRQPLWAIILLIVGLALTLLSLATNPVVGGVGLLFTTAGLWHIGSLLRQRWFPRDQTGQ
jgi:hypothetical protein